MYIKIVLFVFLNNMTTSYPAAAAPPQLTVKQPSILERLSPELQSELLLHLQPRLVGRLTRTCQWFSKQCRSRAYWERVAFHMLYREERLSKEINSLYYLSMLDGGYKRAMERFIALVYEHPKDSGQHATAFLPRAGESLRENTARVVSTTLSEYEDPEHGYRCPGVAPLYREEMLPSADEPRELCRKIVEQTVHTRLRIRFVAAFIHFSICFSLPMCGMTAEKWSWIRHTHAECSSIQQRLAS